MTSAPRLMICHRHPTDWLLFMDLTTVPLSLFLVDYRIKSTGTLIHPKASFGPALELSRSPRPRVFFQQAVSEMSNTVISTARLLPSRCRLTKGNVTAPWVPE